MGKFMTLSAAGQGHSRYSRLQRLLGASEDELRDHNSGSALERIP